MKWNKEIVDKAIHLLKIENKSYEEISKILGCSKKSLGNLFCKHKIKSNKTIHPINKCLVCDKIIKHGYKFCSHSCCAIYNNPRTAKPKKETFCLYCNKKLEKFCTKYCNNVCKSNHANSIKLKQWFDGKITGHTKGESYDLLTFVRKYVFDRANHKCEECGCNIINKHTNRTILQIDHIDGNAANSSPSNLKILCPNCHAQTHTFGFINKRQSARYKYRRTYREKNL